MVNFYFNSMLFPFFYQATPSFGLQNRGRKPDKWLILWNIYFCFETSLTKGLLFFLCLRLHLLGKACGAAIAHAVILLKEYSQIIMAQLWISALRFLLCLPDLTSLPPQRGGGVRLRRSSISACRPWAR